MTNTLKWGKSSCHLIGVVRDGRPCNTTEVMNQIGKMVVFAVSGGRMANLRDKEGDTVGVVLPITSTRRIEVVLDYSDTYTVKRIRYIQTGKLAHTEQVEAEQNYVYCDQLAEVVLNLSTWK